MDEIIASFIEEAGELLLQLEDDCMRLEEQPANADIINNIFRVMHTLKGSAGMVGFKNIQDFTHDFEGLYEQIREGKIQVNAGIIEITLRSKDLILGMLHNRQDDQGMDNTLLELKKFYQAIPTSRTENKLTASPVKGMHCYVVLFSPEEKIFERGLYPDKILKEIESSGPSLIIPHEKGKTWEQQVTEKKCTTTWEIYLKTLLPPDELNEIFLFYDPEEYKVFEYLPAKGLDNSLEKLILKLYKKRIVPVDQVKKSFDSIPDAVPENMPAEPEASVAEEKKTFQQEHSTYAGDATVNVSSHKLDELMNLVSELVTMTATVQEQASKYSDPLMHQALENIEKLTKQFRNNALDLRLVPVGTLLSKFRRQVRDLSKELNKKVNLLIEGADIEIDKTILKSIESPLQHIVRNSIDHGFEPEEERIAKGKTGECLLKITAFYSGANVILQIQDDGRGINLERVKECAIRKGYITADQHVTKQDLINLILEPGFTTSENISMVSGRGVGMDVVRKELIAVGGSLEVFTEKDLGTSITMKLPTTLTIIDTLLVEVDKNRIMIPVMDIEYCFKESAKTLFEKDHRYIEFKNNPIPLISLRGQFKIQESGEQDTMVIVINKFERKYALTADRIIGEHQAVIKPLGDLFANQSMFSGGSIMADGILALILDTNFLSSLSPKNN